MILLIMFALICNIVTNAQNVVRKGNVFIEQPDTTKVKKKKSSAKDTGFVYQDKKGNKYPIYVSKNGKYFIIRTAKTTGKEYPKYLKNLKI